jgi:hypothetical protein
MCDEEYPDGLVHPDAIAHILDWENAGRSWVHSDAAVGWPGGTRALHLLIEKIYELELSDAPNKCCALVIAFDALKVEGSLEAPEDEDEDRERIRKQK